MFDLVIHHGIIVPMTPDEAPFVGSVAIEAGRIAAIWPGSDQRERARETIDASDKIVLPGLINGHVHGDMTLARGLGDDRTLLEQNEQFASHNWFGDFLSAEDRFVSRQLTYLEALKNGTTFVCENMYWSLGLAAIHAMQTVGIRGALVEDARPDFSAPQQLIAAESLAHFCTAVRAAGLIPVVGSVAEEDYAVPLQQRIQALAQTNGVLLHSHLAETTWRLERIRRDFGTTSVRFLEQHQLLGDWLVGSHAVFVDEAEVALLVKAGVRIVSTPCAEMKIADGIAPIPQYLAAGLRCGLGTDGALWNNCNDLFAEMKTLVLLQQLGSGIRSLTAQQALTMATSGGAAVFDQQHELGSLAPGKLADLVLIDANQPHLRPLHWRKNSNVISNLVYCASGRDVHTVIIGGVVLMCERKLRIFDEAEILRKAQAIGERLAREVAT